MRLEAKEYLALALIAVMMLSPLAAAMFSDDFPVLRIWYMKSLTDPESILKLLNAPQMKVYYPDGTRKLFKNLFTIEDP